MLTGVSTTRRATAGPVVPCASAGGAADAGRAMGGAGWLGFTPGGGRVLGCARG